MVARIITFLFGYALTLIGLIYIISYMNLFSLGYNFMFYVKFIFRQIECLYTFIGFIIMAISIYIPGGKNEIYI